MADIGGQYDDIGRDACKSSLDLRYLYVNAEA
jgi:hypothetical protein